MIATIFSIGAFIISIICLYAVVKNKNENTQKIVKRKNKDITLKIRPEFIEESKSEKAHRKAQRKKYDLFDENGKLKH